MSRPHTITYESIDKYIASKKNLWAETTRITTRAKLNKMFRLHSPTPEALLNDLKSFDHSPHTIQVYFEIWRAFELFCYRGKSPVAEFLKANRGLFRNAYQDKTYRLNQSEYQSYLEEAKGIGKGLYNLLILMGMAGLRLSEALAAKWSDLDSNNILRVVGKGGKVRTVPIPEGQLIPIKWQKYDLICDSRPPYRKFFQNKPCTPHDLRAYFATEMAVVLQPYELMDLLGHENFHTTMKYIRRNKTVIRGKLNDYFKNFPRANGSTDRGDQDESKVG